MEFRDETNENFSDDEDNHPNGFTGRPLKADDIPAFLRSTAWESLSPSDWRWMVRGSERRAGCLALVQAAYAAERGATTGEAACLYRAADAVLPLRGPDLRRYALTALDGLPRPLPLDAIAALVRYVRQEVRSGVGDAAGAVGGAVREALNAVEAEGAAARTRAAALRRSLESLR